MRVLVGQFGGPTTVLNAALHGAWEALVRGGAEVWGLRGGGRGLISGAFAPLGGDPPQWLLRAPGAALGAGRQALSPEQVAGATRLMVDAGVEACLLAGGNGTMALAAALQAAGIPAVGIPKTIDNDLAGTDHAPGYPSAAAFVAAATADLAADLRAMAGFEDVRLIEVMGRRAGWLAAASALARGGASGLPQVVLLPELPVDEEVLAEQVSAWHRRDGSVLIVVAEGVCGGDGVPFGLQSLDAAGGTKVLGAAAARLAAGLRERLGLRVRAESLGFLPRCLTAAALPRDREESRALGAAAAEALLAGRSGVMAAIAPRSAGETGSLYTEVPLAAVAGRERPLPEGMRTLGPEFVDWLSPLTGPAGPVPGPLL